MGQTQQQSSSSNNNNNSHSSSSSLSQSQEGVQRWGGVDKVWWPLAAMGLSLNPVPVCRILYAVVLAISPRVHKLLNMDLAACQRFIHIAQSLLLSLPRGHRFSTRSPNELLLSSVKQRGCLLPMHPFSINVQLHVIK
jgi:hypothetical protein